MHTKLEKFDHILEKDLEKELDNIITAGTINPTQVKTVTDAVCLMLKTKEYADWLQEESGDYSEASYRRGRSPVTGRYVSRGRDYSMDQMHPDSYRRDSYGRDMYDMGYSGHSVKDRMVAKLESMMDMAKSDYERQEVMNAIRSIQSMN